MNIFSLKIGEGWHVHTNGDGFGFSKVIVKDHKFYVDTPYIAEGKMIYAAYIWTISESSKEGKSLDSNF